VRHLHACGAREYGLVKEGYTQRGLDKAENIILKDYIYDMPRQMAAADLVICRSGAMTISELALQGKNCILIPSPNVTDNQQYKNARIVKDMGGAVFIEEKDLNAGILVEEVRALRDNPKRRAEMSANIKKFAIPDANKRIYEVLINLLEKKH